MLSSLYSLLIYGISLLDTGLLFEIIVTKIYIYIYFVSDSSRTMADEGAGRGKLRQWDKEDMKKALAACRGTPPMSKRAAAMEFGVPRKTLSDRLNNKVIGDDPKWGRETALTPDEETQLYSYIATSLIWLGKGFRLQFPR